MYQSVASRESYKGATIKYERRDVFSPASPKGSFRVWVWEIVDGPGKGDFGGKCSTKAEARDSAKRVVRAYITEAAREARFASYDNDHLRSLFEAANNPALPGHELRRARERVAIKLTEIQYGPRRAAIAADSNSFYNMTGEQWAEIAAEVAKRVW